MGVWLHKSEFSIVLYCDCCLKEVEYSYEDEIVDIVKNLESLGWKRIGNKIYCETCPDKKLERSEKEWVSEKEREEVASQEKL